MTTTASTIIASVGVLLNDTGQATWGNPALLGWINEAISAIAGLKPEAVAVSEAVTLAAGANQTLPAGGFRFLALDGLPELDLAKLNRLNPGWRDLPSSATAEAYAFDPASPKEFQVKPPSDGAAAVRLRYAKHPAALASTSENIPLDDIYVPPITSFVLWRARQQEGQSVPGSATEHLQAMTAFLGGKSAADVAATSQQAAGQRVGQGG